MNDDRELCSGIFNFVPIAQRPYPTFFLRKPTREATVANILEVVFKVFCRVNCRTQIVWTPRLTPGLPQSTEGPHPTMIINSTNKKSILVRAESYMDTYLYITVRWWKDFKDAQMNSWAHFTCIPLTAYRYHQRSQT